MRLARGASAPGRGPRWTTAIVVDAASTSAERTSPSPVTRQRAGAPRATSRASVATDTSPSTDGSTRTAVVSIPSSRCTARDASARRRLASEPLLPGSASVPASERLPRRGCEPRRELERGPVMLTARKRDDDAVPAATRRAHQDGHVDGRPVEEVGDPSRERIAGLIGGVGHDKPDVVGGDEPQDVFRRLLGRERRGAKLRRRAARGTQGRERRRKLVLHVEQPRDKELGRAHGGSRRGKGHGLRDPGVGGGNHEHGGGSIPGRVRLECGIVREDRALEPLEPPPRFEPQSAQDPPGRSEGVERLGLPVRAIEREHALGVERLAIGMGGDERIELSSQRPVPTARELRLDPGLERRDVHVAEAFARDAREGLVGEVGERVTAPERERVTAELGRSPRFAPLERIRALGGQALEAGEVELLAFDAEPVAGRLRLDRRTRPKEAPQLGDLPLDLRHCRHRRPPCVQLVGDPLHGDDAVRVEQEDREGRALLRAAEHDRLPVGDDLEMTEDRELEHGPTVAPR